MESSTPVNTSTLPIKQTVTEEGGLNYFMYTESFIS